MKRKLVSIAQRSYFVSLPIDWIRSHGLKKGDEVHVDSRDGTVLISIDELTHGRKASVDVRGLNHRIINYVLACFYKQGFDEIELTYEGKETYMHVNKEVNEVLLGFTVSSKTKDRINLKLVAKCSEKEFNTSLRRAFLSAVDLGEESLKAIKKGKIDKLQELLILERDNTKLTNFCELVLSRSDFKNSNFLFSICSILEKIADSYKYINTFLMKHDEKLSKNTLKSFDMTNDFLRGYYNLHYKFSMKTLNDLEKVRSKLIQSYDKCLEGNYSDRIVAGFLKDTALRIMDLTVPILVVHSPRMLKTK
ncbi:AbrB/MazE/SpoVT family DNA-binding domain-containing protein [Nanoarchaeota archaeon]